MDRQQLDFIRQVLGDELPAFPYFKDKYALDLLQLALSGQPARISELKKGPLALLLDKPPVKKALQSAGNGWLDETHLLAQWPSNPDYFPITLGEWGELPKNKYAFSRWEQTSRPGLSLVLQLNFNQSQLNDYFRLIKPLADEKTNLANSCHPVKTSGHYTMAWARMDVDLNKGEVLIEEIQNDWLREAVNYHKYWKRNPNHFWFSNYCKGGLEGLEAYCKHTEPLRKMWDEAVLMAAIHFCRKELGISRIWYHEWETGKILKGCKPPRSLYTELPRRFGFQLTEEPPRLLRECPLLRKILRNEALRWYVL